MVEDGEVPGKEGEVKEAVAGRVIRRESGWFRVEEDGGFPLSVGLPLSDDMVRGQNEQPHKINEIINEISGLFLLLSFDLLLFRFGSSEHFLNRFSCKRFWTLKWEH